MGQGSPEYCSDLQMKTRMLFWFAVGLVVACSGSEEGPGTETNTLATPGSFCKAWAAAACNDSVVDYCDPGAANADGCKLSQEEYCRDLLPTGYNSKNAQACIDAVKEAYTDADLSSEELGIILNLDAPCDKLIKGGGGAGDTCMTSTDCNTLEDLKCVVKPGDSSGTCQVPATVGGGQKCSAADQVCDSGFYCDGSNCLAYKDLGDTCGSDPECAPEQRCNLIESDGGAAMGECVQRKETGADCLADAECQSHICAIPRGADSGVCVSQVRLSAESAFCQDLR